MEKQNVATEKTTAKKPETQPTQQQNPESQNQNEDQQVQQARGPELKEKMIQSQKEGEEYRARHTGADQLKKPGTSNTEKSHKAEH